MAGKIKKQLELIIQQVSKNNPTIVSTTRTKLILKGLNPNKFTDDSPDDPVILEKIQVVANEFGAKI